MLSAGLLWMDRGKESVSASSPAVHAPPQKPGKFPGALHPPALSMASSPGSSNHDPESSPEFLAALVEEAQPVLLEALQARLTKKHLKAIGHEVASLRKSLALTDSQASAIRAALAACQAEALRCDVEAVKANSLSLSDLAETTRYQSREWLATSREVMRAFLDPQQQARFNSY